MNNNRIALQTMLIQARCMVGRINPVTALAIALALSGILAVFCWIPGLQHELDHSNAELDRLTKNSATAAIPIAQPLSQNEQRIQKFYTALGDNGYAEQQVKLLFGIAARNGLTLNQAEYKSALEKNSSTVVYQIQLPVQGRYSAIRQFCEDVLLAIPFASLDQMVFKRETINNAAPEARLSFTLYLTAPGGHSGKMAGQP